MKKTKVIRREVEEVVVVDVLCNKCGESCCPQGQPGSEVRGPDVYGLDARVGGGYFSSPAAGGLSDMCEYTFALCEKCLVVLFDSFVIPVEIYDCLAPLVEDEVDSEGV